MLSVLGATGWSDGDGVTWFCHWSLPEMPFLLSLSQTHTAVFDRYRNLQLLAELCK